MRTYILIFVFGTWSSFMINPCDTFSPPPFGIGAVFFPIPGLIIQRVGDESAVRGVSTTKNSFTTTTTTTIQDASDFFVDAFWTAKVGGGTKTLTDEQRRTLRQSQFAEFNRRYGGGGRWSAAFFVARDQQNTIIACVGVEIDRIPEQGLRGPTRTSAPLMSNLAVSRKYRRRGLAEQLVKAVEDHCRMEWGYEECYLYVEERNQAASRLYQKLGYRSLWRDPTAKTLMPTQQGTLVSTGTALVCMRKSITSNGNLFARWFQ